MDFGNECSDFQTHRGGVGTATGPVEGLQMVGSVGFPS
jgi:hypothetical protein